MFFFFFFLNIIRANDCRERKRRCARVPAVCVNAACAECVNINDVFSAEKTAVNALFETAFLKRRKRRELTFFFHHKRTLSFHLSSLVQKRKGDEGKFSTSSQKLKKLVCGCLEDRGGGRKERERLS